MKLLLLLSIFYPFNYRQSENDFSKTEKVSVKNDRTYDVNVLIIFLNVVNFANAL